MNRSPVRVRLSAQFLEIVVNVLGCVAIVRSTAFFVDTAFFFVSHSGVGGEFMGFVNEKATIFVHL